MKKTLLLAGLFSVFALTDGYTAIVTSNNDNGFCSQAFHNCHQINHSQCNAAGGSYLSGTGTVVAQSGNSCTVSCSGICDINGNNISFTNQSTKTGEKLKKNLQRATSNNILK